jgi:hypothetical protein
MTIDDFMAMEPFQRDAIVADKVLGLRPSAGWFNTKGPPVFPRNYTTSIAEAWSVVEKLTEPDDAGFGMYAGGLGWIAEFKRCVEGEAQEAPLAICIAALRAVGAVT